MKQTYLLIFISLLAHGFITAQYSQVSDYIPMKDFMVTAKQNKVKSVIRLYEKSVYNRYSEEHLFDKNGNLIAWYTSLEMNGVYTYENDSLGRIIKSYHFDYPKTEEYDNYTLRTLDTLGNPIKTESYHANGELFHFSESYDRQDKDYYYHIEIERGEDSSVIRIKTDTITRLQIVDYCTYEDGELIGIFTNYNYFNEHRKVTRGGSLSYEDAWIDWLEQHPEDRGKLISSLAYRYELVDSNRLDRSLFNFSEEEKYTYFENGTIKSAKDYDGIREYIYNDRGFPEKVKLFSSEHQLESVINFSYSKNGLLEQETTTSSEGIVTETINYDYTFWQ